MNNFSSRKITFGQNLTNQNKISSDDKSTCEGRANKTFIEEERNSPPSAIACSMVGIELSAGCGIELFPWTHWIEETTRSSAYVKEGKHISDRKRRTLLVGSKNFIKTPKLSR